jgi:ethanolamine utilization protein EutN
MQIARILGCVIATRKHAAYKGRKLLVAQPLDRVLRPQGQQLVAVDMVDAGVGDLVLVTSEGRWAREQFGDAAPIRSLVVAVLAGVDCDPL